MKRILISLAALSLPFALASLTLACASVSYYFLVAEPRFERLRLEFDREKWTTELARADAQAETQQKAMQSCAEDAEAEYWSYVKLNGTADATKPDVWHAPESIWKTAASRRREAMAECKAENLTK